MTAEQIKQRMSEISELARSNPSNKDDLQKEYKLLKKQLKELKK